MDPKPNKSLNILVFWQDDDTRASLVQSFFLYSQSTCGVGTYHELWKNLQRKKFQILIVSEKDLEKVSFKTSHQHPNLTLVVLTLNHDLDYHETLKTRGAHGVLTVAEIKTIFRVPHKL